ncbi:MAG: hypothetical protein ACOX6H_00485 [Christensenellales bacterium]|jgi:hypothetical protein
MKVNLKKQKKAFDKSLKNKELAVEIIEEKVLNENDIELHTMLMKSDFENYLQINSNVIKSFLETQQADLTDFNNYEKELSKRSGNKKR